MHFSAFLVGAALVAGIPALASQSDNTPEARLARALEGRVAGTPVNCIMQSRISGTRIFERTAILYQVGGTFYVNRPRVGAASLRRDDVLMTRRTTGGRLCRLDTVDLITRASRVRRGSVGLDHFVPYARPPAH